MISYHAFIADPHPFTEDENFTDADISSVKSLVQVTVRASFSGLACDQGAAPRVMSARDNGNDQWWEQHCIQMRSIKHKLMPSLLLFAPLLPFKPCDWLLLFILSWTWLLLVTGSLVMIWAMGHWPHWWHHVWCDQAEQSRPWGHCGSDSNCSSAGLVGKRDNPANAKYFTISTCDLSPL